MDGRVPVSYVVFGFGKDGQLRRGNVGSVLLGCGTADVERSGKLRSDGFGFLRSVTVWFLLKSIMKKCKYCSKEFEPINPKGVFCGNNCRVYFNRRKKKMGKLKDEKKQEQKSEAAKNAKHKLWKEGDPEENTNAFFLRKGCSTYAELEKIK